MLSIGTNTAALTAARGVSSVQKGMETSMERSSTGKRLDSAADDAAGVAIASRLNASLRGTNQSIRNAMDTQALLDTAEGAMQEQEAILQRIRELAVQAANGTNSSTDRAALDAEKTQLLAEIDRIASTTSWAGQNLLDGTFTSKSFQVGGGTMAVDSLSTSISDNSVNALAAITTPEKLGEQFAVNSYTSGDQTLPVTAKLKGGGFVIAWQNGNTIGKDQTIQAQIFDSNGNAVGSEFKLETFTNPDRAGRRFPAITALDDGGFLSTWTSHGQGSDANVGPVGTGGIYGQRWDSSGNKVGTEFRVDSTDGIGQNQSSVSSLSNGGFVVTWVADTNADGDGSGIFGQVYEASGNPVGHEFQINSHTALDQSFPEVRGLDGGGFVVVWTSYKQVGGGHEIFAQRFNNEGNVIGSEFQINTTTTQDNSQSSQYVGPQVINLQGGGFFASWISGNDDGNGSYGLYGQKFDQNGNKVGSEIPLNTQTDGNQWDGKLSPLPDGGFMATWTDTHDTYGGVGTDVFAQRFDSEGFKIGEEYQVNSTNAGEEALPSIATLENGNVVITWVSDSGLDGDGDGIYAQLFQVNSFGLTSVENARSTIRTAETALQTLNSRRASLGALSNRLDHIVTNNTNIATNIAKSISRIEDADFAAETTNLAKQQIIQQASVAMLAQANAAKQNVLSLLQG